MVNHSGKLIGIEICAELDVLWQKHPEGLTIKILQQETSLPYHSVHAAAVWIAENNKAKWARRPDRTSALLVPLSWTETDYDLTEKQDRIYKEIKARANPDGNTTASYKDLSDTTGVSNGSVAMITESLERKKYIKVVNRGGPNTKTTFKTLK